MRAPKQKLRRTCHITIRLSAEERSTIDNAAVRAGLMTGSYVRQVLMGAPTPRQVRRPAVEKRELVRLLGELGSVGNNINQLARAVNSGDEADPFELIDALDGLRVVRDAVLQALGREP